MQLDSQINTDQNEEYEYALSQIDHALDLLQEMITIETRADFTSSFDNKYEKLDDIVEEMINREDGSVPELYQCLINNGVLNIEIAEWIHDLCNVLYTVSDTRYEIIQSFGDSEFEKYIEKVKTTMTEVRNRFLLLKSHLDNIQTDSSFIEYTPLIFIENILHKNIKRGGVKDFHFEEGSLDLLSKEYKLAAPSDFRVQLATREIITNAIKYQRVFKDERQAKTRFTISANISFDGETNYLAIQFKDNGKGISAVDLDKINNPAITFRANPTIFGRGSGLNSFNSTDEIKILLESEGKEKGTTATLVLKLAKDV